MFHGCCLANTCDFCLLIDSINHLCLLFVDDIIELQTFDHLSNYEQFIPQLESINIFHKAKH